MWGGQPSVKPIPKLFHESAWLGKKCGALGTSALVRALDVAGGFTLAELLMAMALVALVVAALATGFRTGIQAWRRLAEETTALEILSAVPAAVQRDLDFLADMRPYGPGAAGHVLPFCGTATAVAFWTRFAPEGAPFQGAHLVAYVHDPAARELAVYRMRMPLEEDPLAVTQRILMKDPALGDPMGLVPNVTFFQLAYAHALVKGEEGEESWVDGWVCGEQDGIPRKLRLSLGLSQGARTVAGTWTFFVGIPQL